MANDQVLNIEVRAAVASAIEDLQQLGNELGGNVGAKAQELSEKLAKLTAHSDTITFFKEMQQQVAQSEQNYRKISAQLVEYERQLGKSTDPQHAARIAQLRQQVSAAREQWDSSRQQLCVATTAQKAQERLRRGNTPAGAGKTFQAHGKTGFILKHPRGRGENRLCPA